MPPMIRPQKKHTSITKIMFLMVLFAGLSYGGYRGVRWIFSGGGVEALRTPTVSTLDTAQGLLEEGKSDDARNALRPIATTSKDPQVAVPAILMLADLDAKAGDRKSAQDALQRVMTEFAASPDKPRAAAMLAKLLDDDGKTQEALAVYEDIRQNAPAEFRGPALCGIARQAEREKKVFEARNMYLDAVKSAQWDSPEWNDAIDALGRTNVALVFAPEENPESKIYEIEKRDSFTSIGIKLNTTQGMLMRANNLAADAKLNLGQRLKWTPKDFRIVIERSKCRIFVLDSNGIFKRYMCGLGKPGHETTLGIYKIGNKEKDPIWHKPGEGPIPAGDPRNLLGTRWMPLVPVQEGLPKDLGIHGAPDPSTVGQFTSNGCARMKMDEVEELYDLVVRSTPVQIVDTVDPSTLNTLAIAQS